MLKRFTIDQVMPWRPCYSREEVAAVFGRYKYMTLARLLASKLSDADKLWCLLRPEVIPEKQLHLLACEYAERALKRERKAGREPDPRSWAAVETKRRWVAGEASDEELSAARASARAAARASASARAWAAASAEASAWASASASASASAWAAASAWVSASASAERKWQLQQAIKATEAAGGENQ